MVNHANEKLRKGLKKSPRHKQKRCLRNAPVNPGFKPGKQKKTPKAWCCIPGFKPGVTKKDAKSVFFLEVSSGFSSQNVCFFKVLVNPLTSRNEKRRLDGRLY